MIPGRRPLVVAAMLAAIAAPLRAQCPDGTPPPCAQIARAQAPAANSIAVLYFDTRDTSDRYLVDGLTEEIILRLQQLQRLEVKSRYESQRVRAARNLAPAAMGRTLGVRYLVNGTVQRSGERVVVRAELTRADRAVDIWSERYDRSSGDVLDVIDAIARGVATGVAGRLLPAETAELGRRPTADPVAYEQFLRGNFYLAQRTAAGLAHAAEAYEEAARRDSTMKPALARIAYVYVLGLAYGVGDLSLDSILARAARADARALHSASEASDTWLAHGFLQATTTLIGMVNEMPQARISMARAVAIDPGSPEAHHQFAQVLIFLGEDSLSEAEYRRALALEPGRAVTLQELSTLMLLEGRYAQARQWADSAAGVDPNLARVYETRGMARLGLGDVAGARVDLDRGVALATGRMVDEIRAFRAVVLVATGDTATARREALSLADPTSISGWVSGLPMAALGDNGRALDMLERIPSRTAQCWAVRWFTQPSIKAEPRFVRIVAGCPWLRS
jgi:TolB-like protein/Tfp pilus assembly protein PilF